MTGVHWFINYSLIEETRYRPICIFFVSIFMQKRVFYLHFLTYKKALHGLWYIGRGALVQTNFVFYFCILNETTKVSNPVGSEM